MINHRKKNKKRANKIWMCNNNNRNKSNCRQSLIINKRSKNKKKSLCIKRMRNMIGRLISLRCRWGVKTMLYKLKPLTKLLMKVKIKVKNYFLLNERCRNNNQWWSIIKRIWLRIPWRINCRLCKQESSFRRSRPNRWIRLRVINPSCNNNHRSNKNWATIMNWFRARRVNSLIHRNQLWYRRQEIIIWILILALLLQRRIIIHWCSHRP